MEGDRDMSDNTQASFHLPKRISDPLMDTCTIIRNKIRILRNGMLKVGGT